MGFEGVVEGVGKGVDGIGVAIIVVGVLASTVQFLRRLRAGESGRAAAGDPAGEGAYRQYRRGLGRAILLGLEFLVAGDIIRTVGISPTFRSVGVLGAIVLIRTFLSVALQLETEGRWPWQQADHSVQT